MNFLTWLLSKLPLHVLERAMTKKPFISSVHIITVKDMKEMAELVESMYRNQSREKEMLTFAPLYQSKQDDVVH